MVEIKTLSEINAELSKLYSEHRPIPFERNWTERSDIRKKIDKLLFREYVAVEDVERFDDNLIYSQDVRSFVRRLFDDWKKDFPISKIEAQQNAWKHYKELCEELKQLS